MKLYIEKDKKNTTLEFSGNGLDLLKKLGINIETVIIVKNGNVVTEKEKIEDADEVKILSVVSGG